ncbi:hypothetical protein H6792_02240 [Candidatus Nomurabacteria bacterium]|nr:hypothetical protein [Candidatus Nomurabacteria bacterium]
MKKILFRILLVIIAFNLALSLTRTYSNYHSTLRVKHLPNTFIFDPTTKSIYLIGEDYKKHLLTYPSVLASYGVTPINLKLATDTDLALPDGYQLSYNQGTILLSKGQHYLIEGKQEVTKRPISSEVLNLLGYQPDQILEVELDQLPEKTGEDYQLSALHPEGSIIRSGEDTFLIENRQLRRFPDQIILGSYIDPTYLPLSATELDLILPRGNDMELKIGSMFQTENQEYYTIIRENGYLKKQGFSNQATYRGLGYQTEEARLVDITELPKENAKPIIYSYFGKRKLAPVAVLEQKSGQLYDGSASVDDQGIQQYYWQVNQSLDWLEGNILNLTGDQPIDSLRLIVVDKDGLVDSKIINPIAVVK